MTNDEIERRIADLERRTAIQAWTGALLGIAILLMALAQ